MYPSTEASAHAKPVHESPSHLGWTQVEVTRQVSGQVTTRVGFGYDSGYLSHLSVTCCPGTHQITTNFIINYCLSNDVLNRCTGSTTKKKLGVIPRVEFT